jgi:hypothetical protein
MGESQKRKLKVVPVRLGITGPLVGEATVEINDRGLVAHVTITDDKANSIFEGIAPGGFSIWKGDAEWPA